MSVEEFGEIKTHILKIEGENIPVTSSNREGNLLIWLTVIIIIIKYKLG